VPEILTRNQCSNPVFSPHLKLLPPLQFLPLPSRAEQPPAPFAVTASLSQIHEKLTQRTQGSSWDCHSGLCMRKCSHCSNQ
jgi:hypothetical protein